jgi:hypothetical protein
MADDETFLPFEDEDVEELFPDSSVPLDPDAEMELSERTIEADPAEDLTVTFNEPPKPVGRGWGYDFAKPGFLMVGHGPAETHRGSTLRTWIEKCLRTQEGAHPVHPDGYGLERALYDWLSEPARLPSRGQLEEAVRKALLFHSAINDVIDFEMTTTEHEGFAYAEISFTVVTNQGEALGIETSVPTTGEVF